MCLPKIQQTITQTGVRSGFVANTWSDREEPDSYASELRNATRPDLTPDPLYVKGSFKYSYRVMIKNYIKTLKEPQLKELDHFESGAWVFVENPSEKELRQLSEQFKLDIGLLKDAVDFYEVPRIEIEDNATFIYTQFPYEAGDTIVTIPALFVIGTDFFITVADKPFPHVQRFTEERIDFYTTHRTKLFLQLFSQINGSYNIFLHRIIRQIKSSRIKLEKITNKDVIKLVTHEEILNNFLSVLLPTSNVLKSILTGKFLRLFEEDKDLVEDLFLDIGQLMELCKSNLKNIGNIRDGYSTIMTNNLNSVIKLLTSLTVVLMVPNIISSMYGMNVSLPLSESPLAFFWISMMILLVSALVLILFISRRYF